LRYQDKIVIVTGAASGIGAATARALATEGATLVLGDRNVQGASDVAITIGKQALPVEFEASSADGCRGLIEQAISAHGRIDMLCNIAGLMDWAPLEQFDESRWDQMVAVNLSAVFHLSRAAMPHLVASRGNIVNMASAAGLVGVAYSAAYCATKHGVIGLTKSMAIEFASAGVRVNAICPTGVKTAMMSNLVWPENIDVSLLMRNSSKLGDMIDPEDVAAAVCFLGSSDARQVSGISFPVDGAQTAG
jgi:meso-butanediol dehydrogenase/(S,S)-butanediol dehydrogenase/diacetyl reductase